MYMYMYMYIHVLCTCGCTCLITLAGTASSLIPTLSPRSVVLTFKLARIQKKACKFKGQYYAMRGESGNEGDLGPLY